jgi:predicted translin family RNA/ssDNA-binding protein
VLHDSKRIIFALHREDLKKSEEGLVEVEGILKKLEKDFGVTRIYQEGAYKAAVEEYAEAKTLYLIMTGKKIDKFPGLDLNYESYLGGICDLVGELVRRATNEASKKNFNEVENIAKIVNDIMAELVEFDMTGYLRTKYDQARGHLRKIEQINYEVNLRK